MNQKEFMKELSKQLQGFVPEERDNAIQYYKEYLEEAENPVDAIRNLPHPAQIARDLRREQVLGEGELYKEASKTRGKLGKIPSLDEELQQKTLKTQLFLALSLEIVLTLMVGVVTYFFGDEAVVNIETGAATTLYYSMVGCVMATNVVFSLVSAQKGTMTAFSTKYLGYFVLATMAVWVLTALQFKYFDWDLVGWLSGMPQETLFQRVFYLFLLNALDGGYLFHLGITLVWVMLPMNAIRTYDRWKKEHKLYKSKEYVL